ncbi:MAG: NAD-dependent dehydratase [Parcubacteria group bacterium Gr01-1014_18]|nr:MAG: NAD-dependent dehydratase [Parcubacteria group bacterium Greene0416_36]TSC81422.1 MAG: NAD-dependent dehydratase [Parcubacteria group bacterium Gr01-1014_18]TSC99020.1 MAG: NAD-dependent dehydratase [Parcubacteria group bacterium Greene1014_20]TSD07299.1 MAG: NAD-dependent dehydratase [Parcubacteria group bacterium Greene0714_2]
MPKAIFDKKNVLVLGGAGFIGSHLCEELLRESKVICVDNFISSTRSNIEHLLKNPNFILLKHDIIEPLLLENLSELDAFNLKFQGIQEVYNLAIPMNPKDFEQVKIQTLLANSYGTKNALDLALKYKAKLFHASSAVVYGERIDEHTLFAEDYVGALNQFSPRSNYDLGKKFSESMVYHYNQAYGVDGRIGRIFRTYGPRTPLGKGHMIPDFIVSALRGEDLVIYGNENFTTTLVYVSDVVDAILRQIKLDQNIGAVNIGTDVLIRLVDVCGQIIRKTNSNSKIRFEPTLLFMSELGIPDITRAREKLGWLPIMTLDKGLDKAIEYTLAHEVLLGVNR